MTVMADSSYQKRSFLPSRPFKDDLPISQRTAPAPASATASAGDTKGKVSLLRHHAAAAISDTIQKVPSLLPSRSAKADLPISQQQSPAPPPPSSAAAAADTDGGTVSLLRRRLSSVSVRIRPLTASAATTLSSYSIPFRRARSLPTFHTPFSPTGPGAIRRWWDWGVGWLMSCKPSFAREMDLNDEESATLGYASKGSWRHVLHRVRAEIRRIVSGGGSGGAEGGKGFRYDSFSYAQNFDEGRKSFQY